MARRVPRRNSSNAARSPFLTARGPQLEGIGYAGAKIWVGTGDQSRPEGRGLGLRRWHYLRAPLGRRARDSATDAPASSGSRSSSAATARKVRASVSGLTVHLFGPLPLLLLAGFRWLARGVAGRTGAGAVGQGA